MNQRYVHALRAPVARLWVMAAALVVANAVIAPDLLHGTRVTAMANLLAPLALAALAGVPSVLSGGGGLDLSVGPALGFVNVVTVAVLAEHGILSAWLGIPLCVLLGALVGAVNGLLVAYGRLQPIVATLGTFLVLSGLALVVLPQPRGGAPRWASFLADGSLGGYLPHILILPAGVLVLWAGLRRLGLVRLVTAVGSDQRAAYTSGVHVPVVRLGAYTLGGVFAGLAGIALTALTDSADPTAGKQYTLMAIAAVALGGNALSGGRGGMLGPLLGAVVLFLIQLLLSSAQVSSLWIQVVYGVILLVALCLNSAPRSGRRPRVTAAQGV
ncbi:MULTISPECIES: ABC transporter permease [Streptomyces]|uniref:Autoinducer 2 import system permease protein LsrD n=1 Tax=Streptomyces spinosisporus TaxID=2927582 RepID=A0ABS9XS32_9ACTN|nr:MULTISPECIES: ABC transporter permease [Streptomyces]MCI3244888.1 ABC transporter permease [Streptomyces spinosisporus]WUB41259.1 ABC transporter permease [Streptomyces sp. NBC_00588]